MGIGYRCTSCNAKNRGVAATLNELALRARGEYLRLGASDDYLLPGGLDAQVRYLGAHPQKLAVIGDAWVVDAHGQLLHGSAMRDLHGVDTDLYGAESGIRRAVIRHWAVSGAVALLRRSAFDACTGWDESLRIEDWDFFLRLAARDALGFVDLPVCAYRLHGKNLSKTVHVPARIANLRESRQVALRCAPLFDEPDRTLLRAQAHYIAAKVAFLRRRPHQVAAHLLASCVVIAACAMAAKARRVRGGACMSALLRRPATLSGIADAAQLCGDVADPMRYPTATWKASCCWRLRQRPPARSMR